MDFFEPFYLSLLIFLPLVGAAVVALMKPGEGGSTDGMKRVAIAIGVVEFLASVPLAFFYNAHHPTMPMQFQVNKAWISAAGLNVNYHIGVDGLSLWLIILSTLIVPIALLASYHSIEKHVKAFLVLMLVLETGMVGVFCALDMFLFYLFWEVMLVPMYFIIGVWGGERRIYAAIKFVLYTMVGSLLMLVAIIAVYILHGQATGNFTFDLPTIAAAIAAGDLAFARETGIWLFLAFALAFLIKVPLFPFHTWLPDAHVEAPTAGSVILAAVLLKMGTYGLMRFNLPLFLNASIELAPAICALAVVGIIYGALVAMVQPDIKKLVAYSSVSHLGFCVLGIFSFTPMGLQGALVQMLAHGLSTGALFLIIGIVYERRHTRMISEFGGLATPMPLFASLFLVTTFASIGLPLLCGFPGEFLVLNGTFNSATLDFQAPWFAAFAATAMVWGAVYMLWMYQRVVMGDVTKPENATLPDLTAREVWVLGPLVVLMAVMGVYPSLFTSRSQSSIDALVVNVPNPKTPGARAVPPAAPAAPAAAPEGSH